MSSLAMPSESGASSFRHSDVVRVGTARKCSLVVSAFPWNNRSILAAENLAEAMPSDHFSLVSRS